MALPTLLVVNTAVNAIFNVAAADKTRPGARKVVSDLNRTFDFIKRVYAPLVSVNITDSTDAGVSEFAAVTGQLGLAYIAAFGAGKAFPVGGVFQVTGATDDLTDNALATAKSGAVADGDVYQLSGADEVTYLGTLTAGALAFGDNEEVDVQWPE